MNLPLLMTASISTHGMKGACFSDNERAEMYKKAFLFYIKAFLTDNAKRIVFVENSGYDLNKFIKNLGNIQKFSQVEFISLPFEVFDVSRGKGYNEAKLIDLACDQSKFIRESDNFFKVTGRYPIYNINFFWKAAFKRFYKGDELYCDIKDHKLYDWLKLGWNGHSFDCRIFACTVEFWKNVIMPDMELLDDYDSLHLEDLMYKNCRHIDRKKCLRFRREPHFGGVEGSMGSTISFSKNQDSGKAKLKRLMGNGIRTLTPWFWF